MFLSPLRFILLPGWQSKITRILGERGEQDPLILKEWFKLPLEGGGGDRQCMTHSGGRWGQGGWVANQPAKQPACPARVQPEVPGVSP
jgi:hypothetical protein